MDTQAQVYDRPRMWSAVKKLYPKATEKADVTLEQLADALRKKFAKVDKKDLARCERCGELSPATDEYEACPFCGEAGVEEPEKEDAKTSGANGSAKKGATMKAQKVKAKAKDEKPEPVKKELVKKELVKKQVASVSAEVVPVVDAGKVAELRHVLDESVKNIRRLQKDMLTNGYDLGRELTVVFAAESWKARGKFRNFKEWCMVEVEMSSTMARNFMAAANEFDRATYAKLGATKLAIIARLPEAKRAGVLKMAEEGADVKTIQAKVAKVREHMRGDGPRGPGRPADPSISAVVKLSATPKELVFYAQAKDAKGQPVLLDAFEDGAWTFLDLGGGVWMKLTFAANKAGVPTRVKVRFARKKVEAE